MDLSAEKTAGLPKLTETAWSLRLQFLNTFQVLAVLNEPLEGNKTRGVYERDPKIGKEF